MKARIKATGEIVTVRTWETYTMTPRVKCISFWQGGNYTEINGSENFEILPDEPEPSPPLLIGNHSETKRQQNCF